MEGNFELYEISVALTEIEPIDENTLRSVLDGCSGKDAIFKILFCGVYPFNPNYKFDDGIEYYKELVGIVGGILGIDYTEKEKLILALYTMPRFNFDLHDKESATHTISVYESVCGYDDKDVLDDCIWWARECARYKLLDLYAGWVNDNVTYDNMKMLLTNLKQTKDRYMEIGDNLVIKYRGGGK